MNIDRCYFRNNNYYVIIKELIKLDKLDKNLLFVKGIEENNLLLNEQKIVIINIFIDKFSFSKSYYITEIINKIKHKPNYNDKFFIDLWDKIKNEIRIKSLEEIFNEGLNYLYNYNHKTNFKNYLYNYYFKPSINIRDIYNRIQEISNDLVKNDYLLRKNKNILIVDILEYLVYYEEELFIIIYKLDKPPHLKDFNNLLKRYWKILQRKK